MKSSPTAIRDGLDATIAASSSHTRHTAEAARESKMQSLIQEAQAARALRKDADRFSSAAWLAGALVKKSSKQVAGMLQLRARACDVAKTADDAERAVSAQISSMPYIGKLLATHSEVELAALGFNVPALKWERDHPGTCYSEMPSFEGAL